MKYLLCLVSLLCSFSPLAKQTISVAVAGGVRPAMIDIQRAFEQSTGNKLNVSYASVGMLYAQIQQGAPFDAFISADINTPKKLEEQGIGVKGTRFSYSVSKLVLWSDKSDFIDSKGKVLSSNAFKHLALPNPKVGVHGQTAIEVLKNLGVYDKVASRLVEGKNALQTYEFLTTGVAELGFISYSLIYKPDQPITGSYWVVPQRLYPPMIEQAILLQRGKDNAGAKALLAFLTSDAGKAILQNHGYSLPE